MFMIHSIPKQQNRNPRNKTKSFGALHLGKRGVYWIFYKYFGALHHA